MDLYVSASAGSFLVGKAAESMAGMCLRSGEGGFE